MKIEQEPLLLEAFGPCLPRAEALHKFFQQVDHVNQALCVIFCICNLVTGDGEARRNQKYSELLPRPHMNVR